jgi:hypothetical protein
MRHPTWAVWAIVGGLAAGPAAAADDGMFHVKHSEVDVPRIAMERVTLNYAIYFGGLHIVDLETAVDLAPSTYEVQTQVKTVGFAQWATEFRMASRTEGLVDGLQLQPHRHRVNSEFRGRSRSTAIDFNAGEVADVRLIPALRADERRNEVPRAMMRGTTDPTSALLAMTRRIAATQGCAGRVSVFDGRHRYDVVVVERGNEELPRIEGSVFSGPALRCDFTVEPLGGYDLRSTDPEQARRRFHGGRAWFAELIPGRPAVPVRLQIDGELASALVYLRAVDSVDRSAAVEQTN